MDKTKVAFLFPGQGAQYPGMAMDLLSSGSDAVKKLFDTASEIFGRDSAHPAGAAEMLNSDADTLKRTDVSQPAITVANLAAAAYLAEQGYVPAACAGFSLGEYAALVCSGVLSIEDCLKLIKARGDAMQKTCDAIREAAGGDAADGTSTAPGMAAIVGLAPNQVEELLTTWLSNGQVIDLYAANINSPKQVVVAGTSAALQEAETLFKEAGAKRVLRLQVAGPFHSPLMADAAAVFAPVLETVVFNDPAIPVFSNVTGKAISSGEEAKKLALQQITSPVRWVEEQASINNAAGIEACLEVGPGKVLQGLWRDSGSTIPVYPAGTVEDIKNIN